MAQAGPPGLGPLPELLKNPVGGEVFIKSPQALDPGSLGHEAARCHPAWVGGGPMLIAEPAGQLHQIYPGDIKTTQHNGNQGQGR